jgi:hypothetical protein
MTESLEITASHRRVRVWFGAHPIADHIAAATHSLATFATAEGFTLGTVYTERDAAESAAFRALLDEVKRVDVRAVVVPTLRHLSAADEPTGMQQHLEFHQARVMAVETR